MITLVISNFNYIFFIFASIIVIVKVDSVLQTSIIHLEIRTRRSIMTADALKDIRKQNDMRPSQKTNREKNLPPVNFIRRYCSVI